MSHATRRRSLGLAAALAVTAALIGTQIASAEDPPAPPDAGFTIPAGELRLHMSTDASHFRFAPPSGSPVTQITQTIKGLPKCGYGSDPAVPNLVNVTADGGSVGFSKNLQLGVNNNDGSAKCTQVNPGESLTLSFKNDAGDAMDGLYASYAMLDFERKFDPVLQIEAFVSGGTTPVYHEDYDCTRSDCGPDRDSAGDNNYLRFPSVGTVLFDTIVITVHPSVSAGASLEGGNDLYLDGTKKDTIFNMVMPAEGEICQGGTVSEPTGTGTAFVTWLGEPDPNNCKDYLLTYSRDPSTNLRELEYLVEGATGDATFKVEVKAWDPEPVVNPVPATKVEPPTPAQDVGWCDGTPEAPEMPFGSSWCLVKQTSVIYGPDGDGLNSADWVPNYDGQLMQVTEEFLLEADAKSFR